MAKKHQYSKLAYDGLHLGISRISLTKRFGARLDGVRRVRLTYETDERTIGLRPVKTDTGPAGPDIYHISRDAQGTGFIYCSSLCAVMPAGRYRFVRQTRDGYVCRYDPTKLAGKQ